jgi:tripartite-type tricarboxylate transporter receptor subunit TctC
MRRLQALAAVFTAVLVAGISTPVAAADYPTRPIKVIVPFPPGGAVDLSARLLTQRFSDAFGQQVIIENKVGAAGSVGSEAVANSAADGYTLLYTTNLPLTTNLALNKNLGYQATDFTPIANICDGPLISAVNPALPIHNVQELVAYAKKSPVSAGSSGNGTVGHFAITLINKMAGIEMVHVPYRGGVPSMTAVQQGEIQFAFADATAAMPFVQDGRVRALGVTGLRRFSSAPNIPTLAEQGLPGFELVAWVALFGPKGMPKDIVDRLNAESNKALQDGDFRQKLIALALDPRPPVSAGEFAEYFSKDVPRWAQIVKDSGMKVE